MRKVYLKNLSESTAKEYRVNALLGYNYRIINDAARVTNFRYPVLRRCILFGTVIVDGFSTRPSFVFTNNDLLSEEDYFHIRREDGPR